MGKYQLTQEGFDKAQDELDFLRSVKRKEIADMLKEAVGFGDLSENSEYEAARLAQVDLEKRILILQDRLSNATILSKDDIDHSKVHVGCKVRVIDEEDEEVVYKIVGETEGDIVAYAISIESPVGKALLGRGEGEVVEIVAPIGKINYEIKEIILN